MLPTQVKSTECGTGATPVPESDTKAGELVALLTNETEPEYGPLVSGLKTTFTDIDAPAEIVIGKATEALKAPPVKFADEIETDVLPVFESVIAWVELFPTSTFPNGTLLGDALNTSVEGAVAVPARVTGDGVFDAVLATVSEPLNVPAAVGAKLTASVADCPAGSVNGNAAPTVLKVAPVTLAPVTDKLDPPVFEMVTF